MSKVSGDRAKSRRLDLYFPGAQASSVVLEHNSKTQRKLPDFRSKIAS